VENIEGFFLVPPFFKLSGLRIDTPARNHADTYSRDAAFFKTNKGRRLLLRTAGPREFDKCTESLGEWLQLPQLHILVTQLSAGVHQVSPVYRGKAFFAEVDTDSEVAMIVAEMYVRGGIDHVATLQCDELFRTREKGKLGSKQSKDKVIH
jgi:hypothetical protein